MRRYKLEINCASCISGIELVFKGFSDIVCSFNILTQILKVDADRGKYSDEFIIKLLKKAGYEAKRV